MLQETFGDFSKERGLKSPYSCVSFSSWGCHSEPIWLDCEEYLFNMISLSSYPFILSLWLLVSYTVNTTSFRKYILFISYNRIPVSAFSDWFVKTRIEMASIKGCCSKWNEKRKLWQQKWLIRMKIFRPRLALPRDGGLFFPSWISHERARRKTRGNRYEKE